MTTLCIDFGNTRKKFAVFQGMELMAAETMSDDAEGTMAGILQRFQPDRAILSSVIPHNPGIDTMLSEACRYHRLSHLTRFPFTVAVGKPETMGADRLALAAAAVAYFPQQNNLVIGLGTAITYNFINQYHQFLGGGISPGLEMRFRSLHEQTALLPLVKKDWNFPLIGYDTKTNILSGVIMGMAGEIDKMIEAYAERYGNFNVVLTGGDNGYFAGLLKNQIFADSEFLFKGLYAICNANDPS